MTKKWIWTINITVLLLLLLLLFFALATVFNLTRGSDTSLMNCSSELYEPSDETKASHYLLVDFVAKGNQAQIHYRYFNLDGTSAGSISMSGQMNPQSSDGNRLSFVIDNKTEQRGGAGQPRPMHMNYVSYVSGLKLSASGQHLVEVEMIELDKDKDYAIVLFQPSNTVCGCRLIQ